jgi:nitric oxide dioxygenase
MTPTEITLVQSSFRKIVPIAEQAAALFYARLFELNPALRGMFRGDMHEQGRKLMSMIGMAVASLGQLETLAPAIRALGVRHRNYGAFDEHYASVGAALLWTLQKGLGDDFTPEVSAAWTTTYSLLATTMIDAQRTASVAA